MEVLAKPAGGVMVVEIRGSIDGTNAERLTQSLDEQMRQGHVRLVADCGALDYTSSAGLGAMLAAVKQARSRGGDLRLAAVRPAVLEVLELSGFTSIIRHFPDVGGATASFASTGA